jgi:hypothetical protein
VRDAGLACFRSYNLFSSLLNSGTRSRLAAFTSRAGEPERKATIVTEVLSLTHAPIAPPVRAVRTSPKAPKLSCSFCQVDLGHDIEQTLTGNNGEGSYCSAHCRNCVLALAALHPSVLAPHDFVLRRGVLTDQLLDLWRHGQGPDPSLVLQAAERSRPVGWRTPSPAA